LKMFDASLDNSRQRRILPSHTPFYGTASLQTIPPCEGKIPA
jgi:hypothetical protein